MKNFPSDTYVDLIMKRYEGMDKGALETFLEVLAVVKTMNGGMDSYFHKMGISHARFKVMLSILFNDEGNGISPADLAESLGVKRATITGLLDTLENDQWIERRPDPNDRRGLLIRITEAGKAKLDSVLPAHYKRIGRAMDHLTRKEQDQLKVLIRKFGKGLDSLEKCSLDDQEASKRFGSGVERA